MHFDSTGVNVLTTKEQDTLSAGGVSDCVTGQSPNVLNIVVILMSDTESSVTGILSSPLNLIGLYISQDKSVQ